MKLKWLVMEPKGPPIKVDPDKCTGCFICELWCSFRFEKAFNPSRAAIRVQRLVEGDTEYAISFTNKCDNCGICVRHCPYNALHQVKKKRGS
ncbi:MAG: 4Fe-4S binding protein [Deltaproteobacteria bacterium]|nr:4Fe-4S binding protein [Deltaproteobacteria bacterium]